MKNIMIIPKKIMLIATLCLFSMSPIKASHVERHIRLQQCSLPILTGAYAAYKFLPISRLTSVASLIVGILCSGYRIVKK